ncbi:MAG: hypothetical protein IPK52_20810 [Chloroflexi bacterium]|nr:hypothetical protein [Chloroflexota bacterium]
MDKVIVSDKLTPAEVAPWDNTRVVSIARCARSHRRPQAAARQGISTPMAAASSGIPSSRTIRRRLHVMIFPMVVAEGTPCSSVRPASPSNSSHRRTWRGSGNILACYRVDRTKA